MRNLSPLLGASLLAIVACSSAGGPSPFENIGSEKSGLASVISSNRLIPVVVSYGATKTPSVAIRIDCGANYGHMLEGFGYNGRDFNIETVDTYSDLDSLKAALAGEFPTPAEVPFQTLRCSPDDDAVRDQVFAIYRNVDADGKNGDSDYYLRFRDDPGHIYSLGCWNLVAALGWSQGTVPPATPTAPADGARSCGWGCGWADAVTVPIDRDVLATWQRQGVAMGELNCYSSRGVAGPTWWASRPTAS